MKNNDTPIPPHARLVLDGLVHSTENPADVETIEKLLCACARRIPKPQTYERTTPVMAALNLALDGAALAWATARVFTIAAGAIASGNEAGRCMMAAAGGSPTDLAMICNLVASRLAGGR